MSTFRVNHTGSHHKDWRISFWSLTSCQLQTVTSERLKNRFLVLTSCCYTGSFEKGWRISSWFWHLVATQAAGSLKKDWRISSWFWHPVAIQGHLRKAEESVLGFDILLLHRVTSERLKNQFLVLTSCCFSSWFWHPVATQGHFRKAEESALGF